MSAAKQSATEKGESNVEIESRGSLAPLLAGETESKSTTARPSEDADGQDSPESTDGSAKPRKRDFWKLGKKNEDDKTKNVKKSPAPLPLPAPRPSATHMTPIGALRPSSPLRSQETLRATASPQRSHPYAMPASPSQGLHSSSPRIHSPASSQIFERDVQEDVVASQASPQIPSHIMTENHIPPALDASSEAITNQNLDPDSVEIITHATHQSAAVTITGAYPEHSMSSSLFDTSSHTHLNDGDTASNYGTLDATDVRRLSFISFADVVHAEHVEHAEGEQRRDSAALMGLSTHSALTAPRSPSPIRSPVSSHALSTSPPTSISASVRGQETSPSRDSRAAGSPFPGQLSPLPGELNIETMRQALRKTGSGDLSGFRSQPLSAVGTEEGSYPEKPFK